MNSRAGVERANAEGEAESPQGIGSVLLTDAKMGAAFAEADQLGGPETILLVEDESFVRKAIAEILESAGYRLVIASNSAEALDAGRSLEAVDLLLADVVMPGMSGRELAREFEICCPRARILLMTGYPQQRAVCDRSACYQKYLAKPFSIPTLLRRVREVLDTDPMDFLARA